MATKSKKANNLKPFYWLLGVGALAGIGFIGFAILNGSAADQEPPPVSAAVLNDPKELVKAARGIESGRKEAPVRILVFSDFMCPACQYFATQVEPQLRTEFIEPGKVQLVYYDFPLGGAHRWSFLASRAGRCAEAQGKFWELHDRLFAAQQEWSYRNSEPVADFVKYAREAGVNGDTFTSCLKSDQHAELVSANKALGSQLGVGSTPTLFMNGRMLRDEWNDYSKLKQRIQQQLGTATASTTTAN
jgi:protein-disulfide isomerase